MENKSWFIHIEWFVLLITLLGGFYTLDAKIERTTSAQSARTDKLYEMFIELVKETRGKS
jgi:hypothetical protein